MKFNTPIASLFSILLVSCGGGGSGEFVLGLDTTRQVVSFGDSLSDVGTYEVTGSSSTGPLAYDGGRFTTNPGHVWTEIVAGRYNDKLTPAVRGGFGSPPAPAGGLGYAQGGALVASIYLQNTTGLLAKPVAKQLSDYLASHGTFNSGQLILLNAGSNDVLNAVSAACAGDIDAAAVPGLVTQAANDMGDVLDRVIANGGRKIALVNVSDLGTTPFAAGSDADGLSQDLLAMAALFNDVLLHRVDSRPRPAGLVLIDSYRWSGDMVANYRNNGFKVGNQDVACSTGKIVALGISRGLPDPASVLQQAGPALLCSAATLTEPNADQNFMFADDVHPSTRLNALFAQYVIQRLDARGI